MSFLMRSLTGAGLAAAAAVMVSFTASAQMYGPPKEAFEACEGLAAGAACSHPTPHGHVVQGTCTPRGQRMQCIPSFGRGPAGMPGQGGPQQGGPQQGGMQQGMQGGMQQGRGPGGPGGPGQGQGLDAQGRVMGFSHQQAVTFATLPVPYERMAPVSYTLPDGQTHWYEAVYLPKGGVNWVQAKALAEQAGGYLVTFHSEAENDFVFDLIKDPKFWYKWDSSHNFVMNGPFIGAFQPYGSKEPAGGWKWVSGEPWTYVNWAKDGQWGDRDPRPNWQPNDSQGDSNIAAFGEVNIPVSTWGDFPHRFSSYRDPHDGKAYGFVIEYNKQP